MIQQFFSALKKLFLAEIEVLKEPTKKKKIIRPITPRPLKKLKKAVEKKEAVLQAKKDR